MLKSKGTINKFMCLLCLFIVLTLSTGFGYSSEKGKISRNIYIQDVYVGSMGLDEARKKLNDKYKIGPILIKYNDNKWTINPNDINLDYNIEESLMQAYKYTRTDNKLENIKRYIDLSFNQPQKIYLRATYDELKLTKYLEKISRTINIDVEEANIKINDSGEFKRIPSKDGLEVDVVKLKEEIYKMIRKKSISKKALDAPVKVVKPKITTKDVESIDSILGKYSTSFNENNARGNNIHIAGKSSSDKIIMPQEIFSYNKSTGSRTWSNGYKPAKVIVGGKYVNGEGGGVCQVSTTIYNAALLAALPIEEVHNHTFPSRYAPRGKDAAVSYGYTDLKFKNPYSHPIYIKNIVSNGAITSMIYGSSQDKERVFIKTEEQYKNDNLVVKTYRIYIDEENNKIREELVSTSKYKTKH